MAKIRKQLWREFTTKSSLEKAVQNIVNPIPYDTEFESDFVSDLIVERHWYCSRRQLRPARFKKTPGWKTGYDFWGWFEPKGWHRVSWSQCITPSEINDVMKKALRTAIQPTIADYKASHPICERCGTRCTEDVDHVSPEFDEIYKASVSILSEKDKENIMLDQDWDNETEYQLPEEHPSIKILKRLHETAKLQAVCKDCHRKNARERGSL